jgi:hypothetical protein
VFRLCHKLFHFFYLRSLHHVSIFIFLHCVVVYAFFALFSCMFSSSRTSTTTFSNFDLVAFSDFGPQTFYNLDFSIVVVNKIDFAK